MISQFSIDYPVWALAIPVVSGVAYASILYWKNKKNKLSNFYTILLFIFRFIVVGLISLLLLKPYVKSTQKRIQKPKIIIAIDNSLSMNANNDSTLIRRSIEQKTNNTIENFKSDFEIERISFGSSISFNDPDFSDTYSDYSQLFNYLNKHYTSKEIEAMVLIGDGIFNKGQRPEDIFLKNKFKIFTIAIGDTTQLSDLKINDISYNSINYLFEDIVVELNFTANGMSDQTAKLKTYEQGKFIDSKSFKISGNTFNKTVFLKFKADKKEKVHFRFQLESDIQETNTKNNISDIYIDIIDSKQKILLLANSPHPDLSAIKQSLENFKTYSVDIKFSNEKINNLSEYNLLILHQLPSINNRIYKILEEAKKLKLATLGIIGKQTEFNSFRAYFKNSGIISGLRNYDLSTASVNENFSVFQKDNINSQIIESLPPLNIALLNFTGTDNSKVYAWQKINGIRTNFPLIYFFENDNVKYGIIMGDGIWRWRNHIYKDKKDFSDFDNLLGKVVQYMSVKTDKRRLKVKNEGEYLIPGNIKLDAEFYNDTYEVVKDAEINLKLTNENNEQFDFIFTNEDGVYKLDIQSLESGNYNYEARTTLNHEVFTDRGSFIVRENQTEYQQLKANFNTLYKLSAKSQGHFLSFRNYDSLNVYLNQLSTSKRVSYTTTYKGLNNIKSLLILILVLLTAEWFIRKYMGSY